MSDLIIAFFLVAHGLIHASFVSPRPPAREGGPAWPFALDRSRILGRANIPGSAARRIGLILLAAVLAGFIAAALALLGLVPASLFAVGVVLGSLASLAMLVLFFHPWLTLGIVIDVVLLWAVLVADWEP